MPKERKNPVTSILAHESVKPDKEAIWAKIVDALETMRVGGTSEEIAAACGLDHVQVWKRLSELRDRPDPIIYDVGITRKSSKGRQSMVRQLVAFKQPQLQLNLK